MQKNLNSLVTDFCRMQLIGKSKINMCSTLLNKQEFYSIKNGIKL
jgi:hypothetical protein